MVIIVSAESDVHIPYVTRHLRNEHIVIDVGTVLERKGITFRFDKSGSSMFVGEKRLTDVTGIWLRKPRTVRGYGQLPVAPQYQGYCESSLHQHLKQLFVLFPDAARVSDRYALERAEIKLLQLQAAQSAGFLVPETVITSDSDLASAFVRKQPVSIVKSIATTLPSLGDNRYLEFYTTRLTADKPVEYSGLYLAPSLFQQMIEPKFEVRATVVGDKVFAAKAVLSVSGALEEDIRDWHVGYRQGNSLHFEAYSLPKVVQRKCVRLVKRLGLRFGAIDLICDAHGKFWFIEINPNGQWAFVEREAAQPIGKALAELLEGRQAS